MPRTVQSRKVSSYLSCWSSSMQDTEHSCDTQGLGLRAGCVSVLFCHQNTGMSETGC